jgi:integrase
MGVRYSVPVIEAGKYLYEHAFHGVGDPKISRRIAYLGYYKKGQDIEKWSQSFIGALLLKHPNGTNIVPYVIEGTGKKLPQWKDLTKQNLAKVVRLMKDKNCAKTARTYTKILKAVLNLWRDDVELPTTSYKEVLSVKDEPSENVYLSEADIAMLEAYKPENAMERICKAQWLCEYYLGGRRSDLMLIEKEMIDEDSKIIRYVSKKSKSVIAVPLHRNFLTYFDQAKEREVSLTTFTHYVREICKKAGITQKVSVFLAGKRMIGEKYKYIGSHTARRSFACNLYLHGVDILTISKFMGHSSTSITQTYLVTEEEKFNSLTLSYFY